MRHLIRILIIFLIFLLGFVCHMVIADTSSPPEFIDKSLSRLESIATIFTSIIACVALNNWRVQIKTGSIYSIATDLEKALTELLVLSSANEELHGKDKSLEYGRIIQAAIFRLKQRNYQPDTINKINSDYGRCITKAREFGYIPSDEHEKLLQALNMLTKAINKDFR